MNFWFIIWVFLSVFISGVFLWSIQILLKQKQVWKEFARRHTLTYSSPAMLKSPVLSGVYKGFTLDIFSEPQDTEDQRGRRFRTIIQLELSPGMPIEGAAGSRHFHAFVNGLADLHQVFKPDVPNWNDGILMKTQNVNVLQDYFTPARYNSLITLMTIKSFNTLFIFDRTSTFLRLETADPLYDVNKMDKLLARIAEHAKILDLNK